MAGRVVVPLRELGSRLPEHGRIRLGVKGTSSRGKVIPKSIETFRFTSPDEKVINQLAARYGGTVKPWSDPKASPSHQFEVITEAKELRVWLPDADALSVWYELWTGKGCVRRCDGETVQTPVISGPDEGTWDESSCICSATGNMECRPYTRLRVVLPDVTFGGCWRLETKGWNAAAELPEMERMLAILRTTGMVEATLRLESRQSQGGSKKFVVPVLNIGATPEAMLGGAGGVKAIEQKIDGPPALSIAAEPTYNGRPALDPEFPGTDDDIVEAEIIEGPWHSKEMEGTALHRVAQVARQIGEHPHDAEAALVKWAAKDSGMVLDRLNDAGLQRIIDACDALLDGTAVWRGVDLEGLAKIVKAGGS